MAIALVFVVFDEVHHLPGESYSHGAELSIAPYRLGLTATLERPDGRHLMLRDLVGPTVYEKGIRDLSGDYLSEYNTQRIEVDMVAEERAENETARSQFSGFLESKNLRLGSCFWMAKFCAPFGSFQRWPTGDARVSPLSKSRLGHDRQVARVGRFAEKTPARPHAHFHQ